ncbi:hypothetical protein [Scleromatobacter humisilvae]|uniref:DUF2059 domain-containing protein n=1 Tax=Scleromatobacter humisilvae TaxID=2897159 RepID=A0A9X1YGQ2_9BURK|nr:hypothetical protein [Scleromatobacter humisilvae]MCK9685110.1 hypothetical protein [Scleromatobacter humisilvae]
MIRWQGMALGVVALVFAQGGALAAVAPEAARDLVKKSGMWLEMDSLGGQVRAGMAGALARNPGALPEATKARLLGCAATAYGAEALRATATDAVAGALQPADVPVLVAWYDSELGHRIAALEQASAAKVADPAERLRRGEQLLQAASPGRRASLQAMLAETRSADVMADTAIEMAIAVREGLARADPSATPRAIADIKADLDAKRPQLVARYAQMGLPAYAFAYDGLDDDDLKRNVDYLASAAAKAYSDASVRGVARALNDASVALGRCLKDAGAAKAP